MRVLWIAFLSCTAACVTNTFECTSDSQCSDKCEATGYCSFGDPQCESGRRYASFSGPFANMCVNGATTDLLSTSDLLAPDLAVNALPAADLATADAANDDLSPPPDLLPHLALTILAGEPGGSGFHEAIGTSARVNSVYSMTSDGSGNIYFAEDNGEIISKLEVATGAVSKVAGRDHYYYGDVDGPAATAQFCLPAGITYLDDALYVTERANPAVRKIDLTTSMVSTIVGSVNGCFGSVVGQWEAITNDGTNLYYLDNPHQTVHVVTLPGGVDTVLAGTGQAGATNGAFMAATFNLQGIFSLGSGMLYDGGVLYVAEAGNGLLRALDLTQHTVSTFATGLGQPWGIATTPGAPFYVADLANNGVRAIDRVTGVVTQVAGSLGVGTADGTFATATFESPQGIAATPGHLYVADNNLNAEGFTRLRDLDLMAATVTSIVGDVGNSGDIDDAGMNARLAQPQGLAYDGDDTLFFFDASNTRVRKVAISTGAVQTVAGSSAGYADGTGTSAQFLSGGYLAYANGVLYLPDAQTHVVRAIDTTTTVVSQYAGTLGVQGDVDAPNGPPTAAQLNSPIAAVADGAGNLFVLDGLGNGRVVRIELATGHLTTYSTGLYGGAYTALAIDDDGNLYAGARDAAAITKIDTQGNATLLAGDNGFGYLDGAGTSAQFAWFYGFTCHAGALYVSDQWNSAVRKVDLTSGAVSTYAGTPPYAYVQTGPLPGSLNTPNGLVFAKGSLFIDDASENVILRAWP